MRLPLTPPYPPMEALLVRKLSEEFPALLIVFDLLVDEKGTSLAGETLAKRRRKLEEFAGRHLGKKGSIRLSPATQDRAVAQKWLRGSGGALDGVVAKRLDFAYRSGDRTGMQKIKRMRTADFTGGRFRHGTKLLRWRPDKPPRQCTMDQVERRATALELLSL